jgi:hypothetical protein
MGLVVSLARNVRAESARVVTQKVLFELDRLMAQYQAQHEQRLPVIAPLIPADAVAPPDEAALHRAALANNTQFVQLLLTRETVARSFAELPLRLHGQVNPRLDDEWGNPIVFMSSGNKYIGTAAGGKSFFFSAGRDGKYLTLDDNLYSYEPGGPN